MIVNLNIDRIILDGINLSIKDRSILQSTIESELTRLIENHGWQTTSGNSHAFRLSAAPVQIGQSVDGTSLGQQIARSIHGGRLW